VVVVPGYSPREPVHQRTVAGVRQAVVEVVGCVVLVDLRGVVEWTLARYGDYLGVSTHSSIRASAFKLAKWGSSVVARAMT